LLSMQSALRDELERLRKGAFEASRTEAPAGQGPERATNWAGVRAEEFIREWFEASWPASLPVQLVLAGRSGEPLAFPQGKSEGETRFKCLVAPLEGAAAYLRKRCPGWSLAAIAVQRGKQTSLRDVAAAAMTELPLPGQTSADQLSAIQAEGERAFQAWRQKSPHGPVSSLESSPDAASDGADDAFRKGLARAGVLPHGSRADEACPNAAEQLRGLIAGRARFVANLRPLFAPADEKAGSGFSGPRSAAIACELIVRKAGALVETPFEEPLSAPIDNLEAVSWVGYASEALANQLRPRLAASLNQMLKPPHSIQ